MSSLRSQCYHIIVTCWIVAMILYEGNLGNTAWIVLIMSSCCSCPAQRLLSSRSTRYTGSSSAENNTWKIDRWNTMNAVTRCWSFRYRPSRQARRLTLKDTSVLILSQSSRQGTPLKWERHEFLLDWPRRIWIILRISKDGVLRCCIRLCEVKHLNLIKILPSIFCKRMLQPFTLGLLCWRHWMLWCYWNLMDNGWTIGFLNALNVW